MNSVDAPHPLEPPVKKMKITDFVVPSRSAQAAPSTALPELTGKERPAHLSTPIPSAISDPRSPSYVLVSEAALSERQRLGTWRKRRSQRQRPRTRPTLPLILPKVS